MAREPGRNARTVVSSPLTLTAVLTLAVAAPATAQLRPLEPLDWRSWEAPTWVVDAGVGFYSGQRASVAGVDGDLYEVGTVALSLHLDRVVLQAYGTIARIYEESAAFAEPLDGTRDPDGSRRVDTGDYQLQTIVRLVDGGRPYAAALRFGVRLPTTDNHVGLERDQTDFFALLAGRATAGAATILGEVGMGVHSTRKTDIEQVDPVLYAVGVQLEGRVVTPFANLVGQWDTRPGGQIRGVEDLAELRGGFHFGRRPSISVSAIRGLTEFSPGFGLRLAVRAAF